ncbi:MAG: hypothetical protein NDF55_08915 [archaeon GB-1867-005]|nr:hypothetical protein [Candidatus Culexmicrobium cathedralense]
MKKYKVDELKGKLPLKESTTLFVKRRIPLLPLILIAVFYFWLASQIGIYVFPHLFSFLSKEVAICF